MTDKRQHRFDSTEAFIECIDEAGRSEAFQHAMARAIEGVHPSKDLLIAYVSGLQDERTAGIVRRHLTFCPICLERIRRLRQEDAGNSESRVTNIGEDIPESDGLDKKSLADRLADEIAPQLGEAREPYLANLAPEYFGKPERRKKSAAAGKSKPLQFAVKEGKVVLEYVIKGAVHNRQAYVSLKWKGKNMGRRYELIVYFIVHPDTERERIIKQSLGTSSPQGKKFHEKDLGFNPSTEPWKLAIELQ